MRKIIGLIFVQSQYSAIEIIINLNITKLIFVRSQQVATQNSFNNQYVNNIYDAGRILCVSSRV